MSPVNSKIPNFDHPYSSEQFFERGRELLEKEIKWLQTQKIQDEEILQLKLTGVDERKFISLPESEKWCVDDEDNLNLVDYFPSKVKTDQVNPAIPSCP